jgi:DNA adenine methylase
MSEMHDQEWSYCIQRTDDQKNGTERKGERYKGKELFLLNYDSALETVGGNNQLRLVI